MPCALRTPRQETARCRQPPGVRRETPMRGASHQWRRYDRGAIAWPPSARRDVVGFRQPPARCGTHRCPDPGARGRAPWSRRLQRWDERHRGPDPPRRSWLDAPRRPAEARAPADPRSQGETKAGTHRARAADATLADSESSSTCSRSTASRCHRQRAPPGMRTSTATGAVRSAMPKYARRSLCDR